MATKAKPGDDFRRFVRSWLQENATEYRNTASHSEPAVDIDTARDFMVRLHGAGLNGLRWPVDAGGAARSDVDEQTFREESAGYSLPLGPFRIGLGTVGPTIVDYGTTQQRTTLCPAILAGEASWCQLFSEPEAGTDLAALRTSAVPEGDGFRVNGRKIWNTNAHRADMGVALVRTDPDVPKHRGITMLLLDMHALGVTVSPLREMTGNAVFNEVLLDDVFVPGDMVLGAVNDGWNVTSRMLAHERNAVSSGVGTDRKATAAVSYGGVADLWRQYGDPNDVHARAALVDHYVAEKALALLRARHAQLADADRSGPVDQSVSKLLIGRADMNAAAMASRILGAVAVFDDEDVRLAILASPALAIAGGTEEIQKNIIAERGLGFPREPDPTKGMTFREILALGQRKES